MSEILIVEDEEIIRSSLKRLLGRQHFNVTEAGSVKEAEELGLDNFDLIISDIRLPGEEGTVLIERAAPIPVLILTSYSSVASAVNAMKLGAVDYISKPFNHDEMVISVQRILKNSNLEKQNSLLREEISRSYPIEGIVGDSKVMHEVCERIGRVSVTDSTVLILGESGTGKELVARAIHGKSNRHEQSIISINCAAIPDNLLESELFGHEKGAFTGANTTHRGLIESADQGTLFLDEIGELPLEAQARLLRVLQDGEIRRVGSTRTRKVSVRILAATHRDLKLMVSEGTFREDLFYRLHVLEVTLPPLRQRGEDIETLAEMFLQKHLHNLNRKPVSFDDSAIRAMQNYSWPGNVRELDNVIQRAVILSNNAHISAGDLSLTDALGNKNRQENQILPQLSMDEYFIRFVETYQSEYSETKLSEILGVSRKTLWERRQKLGISK